MIFVLTQGAANPGKNIFRNWKLLNISKSHLTSELLIFGSRSNFLVKFFLDIEILDRSKIIKSKFQTKYQ